LSKVWSRNTTENYDTIGENTKVITKEENHSEHQIYLYPMISLFTSLFSLSCVTPLIILSLQPKKGVRKFAITD